MNPIVTAVLILAAIGAVAAILLVLASKFLAVPVDESFTKVRECLPGANCGGCGYPGCDGYAQAIVDGKETEINKCAAGGKTSLEALAKVTGREAVAAEPKIAVVCCLGNNDTTLKKEHYVGQTSCKAAKLLFSGDGACSFGCLGYGDCAVACPEQAINIINGLAHVNDIRCQGCGACARACPQHVIRILPASKKIVVKCKNNEKGVHVTKICKAGCVGCGLCTRKCPEEAITLVNNLATINPEKCTDCGTCKEVCPRKCIL